MDIFFFFIVKKYSIIILCKSMKRGSIKLEIMKNKSQLEKLYVLLGTSIFIHYTLVILFCFLI